MRVLGSFGEGGVTEKGGKFFGVFVRSWRGEREGKRGVGEGKGDCGKVEKVGEVMEGRRWGLEWGEGEEKGCVGEEEMKSWDGARKGEWGERLCCGRKEGKDWRGR